MKLHVTFTSHYKNELKWSAISLKPSIYTQFMWAKIEARHKSHVLACLHRESALNTGFTRCVSVSAFSRTRLLFWKLANLAALLSARVTSLGNFRAPISEQPLISLHTRLLQILHCHDFTKMHANYMRAQPTVRNEEQREPGKSFDVIKNRATCLLVKLHFSPQISIDNIKNASYFVKYT